MLERPPRGECDTRLGVQVAIRDVACDRRRGVRWDPWALIQNTVLVEADVKYRYSPTDLGFDNTEEGASGLGAVEKGPVGGDGVWLMPRSKMGAGNLQEDGSDVATIGYCSSNQPLFV